MKLPIVVIPPCDELEIVVDYLWTHHKTGNFTNIITPQLWRDLDTLKAVCLNTNSATERRLAVIEGYREAGQ